MVQKPIKKNPNGFTNDSVNKKRTPNSSEYNQNQNLATLIKIERKYPLA
jgi:hypothetical protein